MAFKQSFFLNAAQGRRDLGAGSAALCWDPVQEEAVPEEGLGAVVSAVTSSSP